MYTLEFSDVFQFVWEPICFLLGIFGNMFVLYATIGHNAIKLDKMSIWIIKNLAVADICNCVLVLMPMILIQYGKLLHIQVFGKTFYDVFGCYLYTFFVANLFLVNVLSLNKLMRCVFPLRNLDTTRRQKISVTISTVVVSIVPVLWIAYGIQDGFLHISQHWYLEEDYLGAVELGNAYVEYDKIGETREIIHFTIIGIFNALPCVTLVFLNTVLVIFAIIKSNSAINKRNLLTVILVTTGFLTSSLPYFIYQIPESGTQQQYDEIAWAICFSSSWINPFIYLLINPTFRVFAKKKLLCWKQRSSVRQCPRTSNEQGTSRDVAGQGNLTESLPDQTPAAL